MKLIKFAFLFLGVCMSLCSCKLQQRLEPKFYEGVYFTDFGRYAQQGFFITESNTVPFDYSPVGSICIEQIAGVTDQKVIVEKTDQESRGYDELYGKTYKENKVTTTGNYMKPTFDSLLSSAFYIAKAKGADGMINLNFSVDKFENRDRVLLNGMLIKRKK